MFEPRPIPGLEELDEDEVIQPRLWRQWVIGIVAAALVALLVLVPVLNLFEQAQPQVAHNGLEICSFDYCVVQTAVRSAGHGPTMAGLAGTLLDAEEAQALADYLVAAIGERAVTVQVVTNLPGSLAGRYGTGSRIIQIEEPIRAWVLVHEVAHTSAAGHESDFIDTLLRLVRVIEQDV